MLLWDCIFKLAVSCTFIRLVAHVARLASDNKLALQSVSRHRVSIRWLAVFDVLKSHVH